MGEGRPHQLGASELCRSFGTASQPPASTRDRPPLERIRGRGADADISCSSQVGSNRIVVLEKFPEHAFRLPFLSEVCSRQGLRCHVLHLVRGGFDVARSIARFTAAGSWYGAKGEWKWRQLAALLEACDGLSSYPQQHGPRSLAPRGPDSETWSRREVCGTCVGAEGKGTAAGGTTGMSSPISSDRPRWSIAKVLSARDQVFLVSWA